MGISETCSPVSRKGSKVGSGQPMSPGARSAPDIKKQLKHAQQQLDLTNAYPGRKGDR